MPSTQVKVRGYLIELGEVEAALNAHPNVRQFSVATVRHDDAEPLLVVYVTLRRRGEGGMRLDESLRGAHLRERLPAFMIPSRVLVFRGATTSAQRQD